MAGAGHVSPFFLSVFRRCPTFGATSYDPECRRLARRRLLCRLHFGLQPLSYLLFGRALLVGLSWS